MSVNDRAAAVSQQGVDSSVPAMVEINRAMKLRAASAFITGYLQHARLTAVMRSRPVGVRFAEANGDFTIGSFADGNGNGIRTADIAAGIDAVVDREQTLSARCPSVRIARQPGVPDVNGAAGGDAVRFGASGIATFDPDGNSSAGSLYLTDGRTQLAITVTAATGRVRVRRWDPRLRVWEQSR